MSCRFIFSTLQNRTWKEVSLLLLLTIPQNAGCLNGGGQIKPKTGQTPKELINSLEATYMNDTVSFSCSLIIPFIVLSKSLDI